MILFINACARKHSRTKRLADSLLKILDEYVKEVNVYTEQIPILNELALNEREVAAKKFDDTNPFVALAMDFRDADTIVIAAPHWDLSYPAALRTYIEAIMINGVTFTFDKDGVPAGLCKAKHLYYISTSGDFLEDNDLGYTHIKTLAKKYLGIKNVTNFTADGLDLEGSHPEEIINAKINDIKVLVSDAYQTIGLQKRVMIVDDSKINILKAEHILKENGFFTVSATSGPDCLKKLKLNKVDLILLDIEMPQMDGFEVLEALRSNVATSHIPVIFVTSDKDIDTILMASQKHIAAYITKPFNDTELIEHVRKTLAGLQENK